MKNASFLGADCCPVNSMLTAHNERHCLLPVGACMTSHFCFAAFFVMLILQAHHWRPGIRGAAADPGRDAAAA
jgi:hypothetical protein